MPWTATCAGLRTQHDERRAIVAEEAGIGVEDYDVAGRPARPVTTRNTARKRDMKPHYSAAQWTRMRAGWSRACRAARYNADHEESPMGSSGCGADRGQPRDSGDAGRASGAEITAIASRDRRRAEAAAQRSEYSQGVRLLRGADRRSGDRRDLQSAAQSPARAVVDSRGGGRASTCCAKSRSASNVAEALRADGGPRPHRRDHGRGVHGAIASAVGADHGTGARRAASASCARRSARSATSSWRRTTSATSASTAAAG